MLETPVAFIIFNRPDTTERVFAEIARARPRQLLVIADGPRAERDAESARCAAARAVVDRVDWECDVLKNYSDVNLGCGRRVATGLSWVFEQVEKAIVLEDDCLPHPTFFGFCEELLERYRDDERVMHIGGSGFQFERTKRPFSYFFARHYPSWGWASWRRAWQLYDIGITLWPALRGTDWLLDITDDARVIEHWQTMFDRAHAGVEHVNTWDFQWTFACWAQNGLCILPHGTLVSNIGFREDATHTRSTSDPIANLPTSPMAFPLRHPPYVLRDREADRAFVDNVVVPYLARRPSLYRRIRQRCAAAMPGPMRKSISAMGSRLFLS
jgi:hypothetical protein